MNNIVDMSEFNVGQSPDALLTTDYNSVVHFKGFDNLFAKRSVETDPDYDKKTIIDNVSTEFVTKISEDIGNSITTPKILIVWDGDDFGEKQWTQIMLVTIHKLIENNVGMTIHLLCSYNTDPAKWGNEKPPWERDDAVNRDFLKNPNVILFGYPYNDINTIKNNNTITPANQPHIDLKIGSYEDAGMVLLYITSHLIAYSGTILVLSSGGGQIPVNELNFTLKKLTIDDNDKYKDNDKLTEMMEKMDGSRFRWVPSTNKFVNYRLITDVSLLNKELSKYSTTGSSEASSFKKILEFWNKTPQNGGGRKRGRGATKKKRAVGPTKKNTKHHKKRAVGPTRKKK